MPYPKETDYVKNGTVDYDAYDKAYDDWQAARQERLQTMVDPADVAHWFTSSIPVLLQGAGDENRVCSPLNVYMALAMLAAVTDGQTQGQILDALGEDSLDELQTRAALLWQENSWDDGLVTSLLANSIWLQDGYEYNEDTLKKLGEEFFASAFSGEMGSEDYNKQLQSWLNDNTGGLLTEQAGRVSERIEQLVRSRSAIMRTIENYKRYEAMPKGGEIFLEFIPERCIYRYSCDVNYFDQDETGYEYMLRQLKKHLVVNNMPLSYFSNIGTIIRREHLVPDALFSNEVFLFVDENDSSQAMETLPAASYLCLCSDEFSMEAENVRRLLDYVQTRGCEIAGDYICEVVVDFPMLDFNRRRMFYKAQIPVRFFG